MDDASDALREAHARRVRRVMECLEDASCRKRREADDLERRLGHQHSLDGFHALRSAFCRTTAAQANRSDLSAIMRTSPSALGLSPALEQVALQTLHAGSVVAAAPPVEAAWHVVCTPPSCYPGLQWA